MSTTSPTDRATVARDAMMARSAERAADDPRQVARAFRIVEAAIRRAPAAADRLRALLDEDGR